MLYNRGLIYFLKFTYLAGVLSGSTLQSSVIVIFPEVSIKKMMVLRLIPERLWSKAGSESHQVAYSSGNRDVLLSCSWPLNTMNDVWKKGREKNRRDV